MLNGAQLEDHEAQLQVGQLYPSPDGRFIYGVGGVLAYDLKPLGAIQRTTALDLAGGSRRLVPVDGNVSYREAKQDISFHIAGDGRPLFKIAGPEPSRGGGQPTMPPDRRYFLVPGAKMLGFVPETDDKIVVRRFDLDDGIEKSGLDYLYVSSRPSLTARKGGEFAYTVTAKSKKGGVQVRLETGPDGMKATPAGVVSWKVPAGFADRSADVVLTVTDASGQEVFHTFKIAIVAADGSPLPPKAAPRNPGDGDLLPDEMPEFVGKDFKGPARGPFVKPAPLAPPAPVLTKPAPPIVEKTGPAPPSLLGTIKPAPLKADREERMLPSTVEDACFGGGGRFFILHLPKERKLAIFDVNEARIVKYLPLADDNIRFAAGMDKLFVVYIDKNLIQRFSLATFEKEVLVPLPVEGQVKSIATGPAAAGLLLVRYGEQPTPGVSPVVFIDPVTFKRRDIGKQMPFHSADEAYHYRASPDGSVFGGWVTSQTQSMSSIVVTGDSAKVFGGPMSGSVVPAADNTLVSAGGLFTSECRPLEGDKSNPKFRLRVPSLTGRYYLTCPGGGGAQHNTGVDAGKPTTVYLIGDARPLAVLSGVELFVSNEAWTRSDFTQDKRILFVPDAKLIALIPASGDRLVLHRFDVDEALQKADVDYLFVISRPSLDVRKRDKLHAPTPRR